MAMTLGHQSNMYNIFATHQQHTPPQGNCVIVSTAGAQTHLGTAKSVIQSKRPLAPAPERSSVLVTSNGDHLRCKRKIQFVPHATVQQPASVARRNARERNRVKQVNNGFATLRQHIPEAVCASLSPQSGAGRGANKKLSKVETLRMAVEYIRSLQRTIEDHDMELSSNAGSENTHPDSSSYYSMSPTGMNSHFSYPILLPTPSCSEASTSPTPSQSSESFGAHSVHSFNNSNDYANENYDPNNTADDEELLDVIFSWQNE